jgi:DNA-binding NarL/FixJ family response regulator
MAVTKKCAPGKQKVGVFLIDDHDMVEAGVRTIMSEAPENDLVFAGSSKVFAPEVHADIHRSGADVVLVDITDSTRDPVGLGTIRALRREFGSAVGIIAYTIFPEYREAALACGADRFLLKGATNENHRLAVRTCKAHDAFSRLELFLAERQIRFAVTHPGGHDHEESLSLGRDAFALLYFLAEERAHGEMDWVAKQDGTAKALPYTFRETAFWAEVQAKWVDRDRSEGTEKTPAIDMPRYASMINRAVKDCLQDDNLQLVVVPGGGRKGQHSHNGTYFLNPFIETSRVVFRGLRIPRNLAL